MKPLRVLFFLSAILMVEVQASPLEDGHSLLKSWGFQSDDSGQLVFSNNDKPQSVYQPWTPDMPRLKLPQAEVLSRQALQPLVVSTKQKSHE